MDHFRKMPLPLEAIQSQSLPYSKRRLNTFDELLDVLTPTSRFYAIKMAKNAYFIHLESIASPLFGISFTKDDVELTFFPMLMNFPIKHVPESLKAIGKYNTCFQITEMSEDLKKDIRELVDKGIKYAEWVNNLKRDYLE